jgi:hypothetical protein
MNISFKVLNFKTDFFVSSAQMIFTIFCCLFVKKIQNKVSTPFHGIAYNSNYENHSSNPHQGACSGFQLAACDSKSCLKAGCDLENCSESRL